MLVQKIRRSGNSYIVTVPKDEVERLGIREGDLVGVEFRRVEVIPQLEPEVAEAAEASLSEFADLYRHLADR